MEILTTICAIGIPANLLVILVILIRRLTNKNNTMWYILQLAIADLLLLLSFPFKIASPGKWRFSEDLCKATESVYYISYYSSILFLTVMAIERCIVIRHFNHQFLKKFVERHVAYIVTVLVWAISVASATPAILYSSIDVWGSCNTNFPKNEDDPLEDFWNELLSSGGSGDYYEENNATESVQDFTSIPDTSVECIYDASPVFATFIRFNFIVMFLIPLTIIVACYALIAEYVIKMRYRATGRRSLDANRKKVIYMCLALVLTCTICWAPHHILYVAFLHGLRGSKHTCDRAVIVVSHLTVANSAINPFLYFIITNVGERIRSYCTCFSNSQSGNAALQQSKQHQIKEIRSTKGTESTSISQP